MKLYTRTGDDGTTGLYGGQRVEKDSLRVSAYGDIDELNSHLGLARACSLHPQITGMLTELQERLFEAGADLATPHDKNAKADKVERFSESRVAEAEKMIDDACETLPAMKYFILPGGSELSARLHVARTVCRRAERAVLTLSRHETVNPNILIYLNRVSDLLFALARRANQFEETEDIPWRGGR
jgi:cob(I)alamin adenosyltransferase